MFAFRHQPLKALYYTYVLISLPVRFPYWVLVSALPAWRPRRSWTLRRAVMIRLVKLFVDTGYVVDLNLSRVDANVKAKHPERVGFVWVDAVPAELVAGEVAGCAKVNNISPVRVPGYWYGQRTADGEWGQRAEPDEKVLYVLHGGGYFGGSGAPDGLGVPSIVNGILANCKGLFRRAFALDYRLSSTAPFPVENPFPAALIDALSGYRYLVEALGFSPDNIVVEGDSAGGHLTIALTRYLISTGLPGLPPPHATILLSPTADWACTHDTDKNCSMERNYATDYVYPILKGGYTARALTGALPPDAIYSNAYLSPASLKIAEPAGLFKGFPPTYILAGGLEHTLDGMITLRDRIVNDCGTECVKYMEYEDAMHDFLAQEWHEPERTQALLDIQEWLGDVFNV
ncbi:alpha/beta-hydrolase [Artomyces pyxidatus]|uniref:Alpha/beta-hydrolase n=1 Tax=Artomyces pyxidatus TaxID=48021 RepID=A0ACB8SP64_9AGAM|nr:alpha/beta-hydrolase [Artomyces pyxidatus]